MRPAYERNKFLFFPFLILSMSIFFSSIAWSAEGVSSTDAGAELRKKLFIIERELSRQTARKPMSLSELVLGGRKEELPDSIEPAKDLDTVASGTSSTATSSAATEPGNVSFSLGGGRLTGFNFSSTGLDFSEGVGLGLKLMLRPDSVDLASLEKDGNMRDSFASANRESFYGLENYERFKDLFKEEEKAKDYSVTGVGTSFETSGLSLSVLNFSKPPQRKKIVFFGNDGPGPYRLNVTNIIPGSEIVRVDGAEMQRGGGYTISYTKGELTFSNPVAQSGRVVVEYEVAGGGAGEPGRFTGFRIGTASEEKKDETQSSQSGQRAQREDSEDMNESNAPTQEEKNRGFGQFRLGPLSVDKWGATYLEDSVITYNASAGDVTRREVDHSLLGADGSVSIGKSLSLDIEFARSEGNKTREVGRYARAEFTIADTRASDDNPLGPYQLDETKLPILESSDAVRVNGVPLEREKDYTLDLEYGTLKLKKVELNLSELDVIEVEYRYLTEEDRTSGAVEAAEGMAGLVSMKNKWGDFSHNYSIERRDADFMLVGGRADNQLKNEKQELAWDGGRGLSFSWGRTLGLMLQDRNTGLKKTDRGQNFSGGWKKGGLQVSFKKDLKEQFDNLAAHQVDSEKENQSVEANYEFSKEYRASFSERRSEGSDLRTGGASSTFSRDRKIGLDAEPSKKLKLSMNLGTGNDSNTSAGRTRESGKKTTDFSMKYKPNKKLSLTYDMGSSDFSNEEAAVDSQAAAAATGTPETGSRETKWGLNWQPREGTTLTLRNSLKRQDQVNGATDRTQTSIDLRHKLSGNTDFQYQRTVMDSSRPNQSQGTENDSVSVKTKAPWFDGMEITLKHDRQKTRVERIAESATRTDTGSTADSVAVRCAPFWEKRSVTLEFTRRGGEQETEGQTAAPEDETKWKAAVEVPFRGESYFTVSRESSRKTGRRETRQENTVVSLNGSPFKDVSVQMSYRSEDFTDSENPQSSRSDGSFDVVLKMDRKW